MIIVKNIKAKNLFVLPFCGFSTSAQNNTIIQNINTATEKVRLKQSVADVKKLQSYLQETRVNKNLNLAINRTAKYDDEFKSFLQGYKEKNREFANIIDLSHYNQDQNVGAKNQQMREEEIRMLEEFRKRKQNGTLHVEKEEASKYEGANRNPYDDIVKRQMQELYSSEDFLTLILARDSTTLVTKLNRVNHFRYLIFMGNCNGVIGYGKGKGNDFESAMQDAVRQCKKNLIVLNLDHSRTLSAPIYTSFNGLRLNIEPKESMNAWGSPLLGYMLMLAGVTHCRFSIVARNMSNYNLTYAFFKAMTSIKTPKQMAEMVGQKLYHQSFAPWKYSDHPSHLNP